MAVVSGGGRGIGRAIVLRLAQLGADVAIGYASDADAAREGVSAVEQLGRHATAVRADVATASGCRELVSAAVSSFGRLDVAVCNAGHLRSVPIVDTTEEDYDAQQNTNARGSFFLLQAVARHMIAQNEGGRIIVITSKSATRPVRNISAYSMSKAAQHMLVMTAALELAPYGIRVNAVAPGTTETDMNRALLQEPESRENLTRAIVLGRPGRPDDIAPAVGFLASDEAAFITGAVLAVDGGSAIG